MIDVRESFGAKLLSALVGTVGLLLIVTLLVVRMVTARQVEAVAVRTTENAGVQFEERGDYQLQVVARLARPFTEGRRALAMLDAAISEGSLENLADQVDYEMLYQDLTDALVVFTDPEGEPVLSVIRGASVLEGDPADIQPLADRLLRSDSLESRGYRVVDGTMYNVRSVYLELAYRPIGTITLGLPVERDDVQAIAGVGGFEACLFHDGDCIVETDGVSADTELRAAMLSAVGRAGPLRIESGGSRWSIRAEPLVQSRPEQGQRIVAVPLDAVLAPFESIQRALLFGGGGALLLAIVLGTALSRGLTRPVRALVRATERVAEGEYETEVTVDSRDELGTLADAFNEMTRGLLVREQYRSVLSKVVSEDIAEELMKGDVELGGENRNMTVLFADIRGFTPLTERMEPQQVIGILNECMERLASAVDAEGGVVDKFIGDEIMAVFGAPVTQPDHALRAVRAAVRMREGIADLNRERARRGEGEMTIGIGISTGVAVAGNMGSHDRLNYTVLGATVNLASRLTSAADEGRILMSGPTREAVGDACRVTSLGARSLKGFSSPVEVFGVESVERADARGADGSTDGTESPSSHASATRSTGSGAALVATLVAVGTALVAAAPASAQWPTLRDAGIGYLSGGGTFQVDLSGQLDLETFYFLNDQEDLSGLAVGHQTLFAPRLRLFLDTFLGDHLYGLVEWRVDRGEAPTADYWGARIEQAYVRLGSRSGAVSVQGGIFPSPFGSYSQRHLTLGDPFIRPPLLYDYRTVISRSWSPPGADWFSQWKMSPEEWRADGAPPVWCVPYQWGAMTTFALGPLSFRFAGMNSAPSSEPSDWYELDVVEKISWIGGVQAKIGPELTLGVSYDNGPFVGNDVPNSGGGPYADTYDQELWSADASFVRGPLVLRAEYMHDAWDVPNVEDRAIDRGYSIEAQIDVAAGWSTAVRMGGIDFRPLGTTGDWDWDVTRLEAALGYRIAVNAGVMATFGSTWQDGPLDPDDDLAGVRLWWAF